MFKFVRNIEDNKEEAIAYTEKKNSKIDFENLEVLAEY